FAGGNELRRKQVEALIAVPGERLREHNDVGADQTGYESDQGRRAGRPNGPARSGWRSNGGTLCRAHGDMALRHRDLIIGKWTPAATRGRCRLRAISRK